jgi:hypothetical protein
MSIQQKEVKYYYVAVYFSAWGFQKTGSLENWLVLQIGIHRSLDSAPYVS